MDKVCNNLSVLMYGWEYPPHISGGLGVACHAIVENLGKKNIKVNLILPYELDKESLNPKIQLTGVDVYKDSGNINIYKIDSLLHPYLTVNEYSLSKKHLTKNIDHNSELFVPSKLSGRYGANLFDEVARFSNIASKLAKVIPHDVIHVHDWMTIPAGIKARAISHKPLIFHVHALETDRSGFENINRQIFDIEKYGLNEADKIITVSNYTKEMVMKYYGIPENKITVVYNGIDKSYASYLSNLKKPHQKMVLFLGRVTHQKGPYFFVEIAKKILETRKDVQFVIAGTGNLLAEMIHKVAANRIGQHVHFTGFLDQDHVKLIYQLADVYVMPSVSEPFGLSCLEALAHGVPAVISNQSGASEVLTHVLHADFWDINKMTSNILSLLDRPSLRTEIINNVKKEMQYLTWEDTADKINKLYKESVK